MDGFRHRFREGYAFAGGALLLVSLIIAGLLAVERAENRRFLENQHGSVVQRLSTIRARLEGDLNADLLLTRSIITEIAIDTDITQDRFFKIAGHFWKSQKHIRNLGLAKGTTIAYVYPLKGNEKAIGLEYKNVPSQWPGVRRVIEGGKTIIAGPLTLVQGGVSLIGRSPIYVDDPVSDKEKYFGILSVVIDIPSLFQGAGLGTGESSLEIAIRGKDGLGAEGDVFHGSKDLFAGDAVLMEVSLPEGKWLMAAVPTGGWKNTSPRIAQYRIVALIVAMIVLSLLFIQQREMNNRKRAEKQREEVIRDLRKALSEVKQLSGLLPICSHCKKVRDDKGYWNQIESYISKHTEAEFSHSICDECAKELYPGYDLSEK